MRPIVVSTHVSRSPDEVFAFLDVLANHMQFTDHMLVEWSFSGPPSGIGAAARARAATSGKQWVDITVTESVPPARTVEETIGANGKRRTRGTYSLVATGGGTDIGFKLEYLEAPLSERILAPAIRGYMRRVNGTAMRRLAGLFEEPRAEATPGDGASTVA